MSQGIARPDANKAVEDGGNLESLVDAVVTEQDRLSLILVELRLLNLQIQAMYGGIDDLGRMRDDILERL